VVAKPVAADYVTVLSPPLGGRRETCQRAKPPFLDGAEAQGAGPRMDVILGPLIDVVLIAINLFIWAVIISAILSWLVAFNVVNPANQVVSTIGDFLHRLTEPALRPIRSILPDLGGIDISPIVLILILYFLQGVLAGLG